MEQNAQNNPFVTWFRQASPYIHSHRGNTFVVTFGGRAVADECFPHLIQDMALMHSLGIRLVLVHGTRPQIEERLQLRNADMQIVNGLRITDAPAMACVKDAAGAVRVEIEALLSMGLANSPMAGAEIEVISGNFVTAKPLGIIDGVDYQHTGEVRKVNATAIQKALDTGAVVLVSPLGYSPTGEAFNLSAADVAAEIATSLQADKLIFLTNESVNDQQGQLLSNLLPKEVDQLLENTATLPEQQQRVLRNAASVSRHGVHRTHILSRQQDGVLLTELFTRDGAGTLITSEPYESIREATIDDVGGILELIEPLEAAGVLVRRSRELIENEIRQFTVIERDGTITACAALYPFADEDMAELACLAVHQEYRDGGRGDTLLAHLESRVIKLQLHKLFVLTTRTTHWFIERGFQPVSVDELPDGKRDLYNWQRNSKLFIKTLG
jgi:amino-acid N-acetyltransferase